MRPTNDSIYLADKINDAWDGTTGRLTPAALQRFVKVHGDRVVEDALRELHGFPPSEAIRSPFAYLKAILEGL